MALQPWKDVENVDPLKELTVRTKAAIVSSLENAVKQNKGNKCVTLCFNTEFHDPQHNSFQDQFAKEGKGFHSLFNSLFAIRPRVKFEIE